MSDAENRLSLKLYLSQSMLESVVYGCYMVTFGMTMYVSIRRKGNTASRWDFWALIMLFLIATVVTLTDLIANASILYNTFGLGGLRPGMSKLEIHRFNLTMQYVAEMGFVFANILADCVLIRRCYVVWNSNIKAIVFPVFLSVVNNSIGFSAVVMLINVLLPLGNNTLSPEKQLAVFNAANKMLEAFFAINVVSNVLLTVLIAGRIWWIMRGLEKMSSDAKGMASTKKRYMSTIALLVESGLLYPISVIVFEIILQAVPLAPSLYPLMTILAGMAPTLIIVRVWLGVSVNTFNESVNTLRLTALNNGSRGRSTTFGSVADHSNSSRQFVEKEEEGSL
ncbi:hypothetical protein VKT23_017837 [Stygiomarasmius scandens]|uniref:G protein-coupled receptor n=1 Tax=Marasmiellus scandens TaxID=2682957 RepID=A0ABR1IR23_9AGAR